MPLRELLLKDADTRDLTKLAEYEAVGGYKSLRKAVGMERQAVLDELLAANVRGRGGAGFPMGRKASFLPKPEDTAKPIYLVVNADESEPGTFKDRELMLRVPHLFIEGVFIASYTIGSSLAFIYVRGEYLTEYEILTAALEEARKAGFVGKDVLGSGWDLTVVVHRGAGAYICGEETGLLESLEGRRGQPRTKPPFPAISGLYASPTLINNVETLATVPKIVEMGGAAYARLGVENSAGTRVFSLSGNVANGGNYELELGTTLRELIYDLGGGIPDGRELKAVIPGGSSVPVLTAAEVDTPLDFDSMAAAGTMLGSGRRDRDRRPLLHGAARPAGRAVLHARVLREVHAVPRRHALDGAAPPEDRGRRGDPGRARRAAQRLRPDPRQLPLPARRRSRDADRQLRRPVPRRVPAPHRRGRLPVRRRVVPRGRARAGRPASRARAQRDRGARRAMTSRRLNYFGAPQPTTRFRA